MSDKVELAQAVAQKNQLIAKLNQANYKKIADSCDVITGKARFVDANTVQVKGDDGELTITAKQIYINTGTYNWQAPIDGLAESKHVYDGTTLMQLTEKPKHLLIIGGGYIGLEFAFTMANFGSQVTILETGDIFLPKEDEQIRDCLIEIMKSKNIQVKTAQKVEQVSDKKSSSIVKTQDDEIECDVILVATGRRANVEQLDLDKAGVKLNDKGYIDVNEKLQTSQAHIYAMGDVAGSPQFTYISLDDFRVVKSQVLGDGKYTTKDRTFPYAVFTMPPLASTGLTEAQAIKQGYSVKTAKLNAVNIPKAKILQQTDGLLKAVIDAKTDKILGVQLLCAEAHEMINFADLAIRQGMTYQDMRDYIFTHPTMMESLNDLFGAVE
ncbi:FAD-dependent oxidoreductase [Acinetobacter sp. c3-l95]|uniref:FAD-dependent oxidoreductase n=1 Tax=Acinetobacter sp. c3-l95 TaxID=3342804 RepID=UPI0035BB5A15